MGVCVQTTPKSSQGDTIAGSYDKSARNEVRQVGKAYGCSWQRRRKEVKLITKDICMQIRQATYTVNASRQKRKLYICMKKKE